MRLPLPPYALRAALPLALLLACALPPASRGAPPAPGPDAGAALSTKRVLVLVPYAFGRPGLDSFVRHYSEGLRRGGIAQQNILVEYLGLERSAGTDERRRIAELMRLRHGGKPIDFISALQQPGLDFVLDELKDLAPEAPVLALDAAVPGQAALGRHRLLLPLPQPGIQGTLQQALQLFPASERLIVAVGASPTDQKTKAMIASIVAQMGLRIAVEYTDGLSMAGMLERVASAPPHTIVLVGPLNTDALGAPLVPAEAALALANSARSPVFTLFSVGIGDGLLGGSVRHVEQLAEYSAGVVLEVLSGRRTMAPGVGLLPIAPISMYDWRQLERWNADPGRLPAGTLFVHRPPSVWDEHRAVVLAGAAAIAVLSLLSASLLVQRRRLRVAEQRFRVLVEHAPEAIVVFDAARGRFVDCNSKAEQLFGATREQLLARGPADFYDDSQPDGLPAPDSISSHAQRSLAGEELVFERSVRTLDGRSFPCEVSVVALPSAAGPLLRGGYVDISGRKRAALELAQRSELLERQVAERTSALSQAAHEAQAANRAKSVFLANMSHELRTPLNSIIGFSQIMLSSTSMFDEEKHNLGLINRAGHHLLSLINDILELSRIEAGQVRLALTSEDIGALMREALDMVQLAARQKGIALALECAAAPAVLVDGGKLRQVLINLLSNAVKFTDAGGVVLALAVGRAGDGQVRLHFTVRDSGIGIAGGEMERIFDPFIQADTPRSAAGTGLGLTISLQFVQLLGGELKVRSRLGEGSEFHFTIDAREDPHAAAPAATPALNLAPAPLRATIDAAALQALPAGQRQALGAALQQLDMRQVDSLLGALRAPYPAEVAAIGAMLAQHRYPELCALLAQGVDQEA